jgi:perosamine synthetase
MNKGDYVLGLTKSRHYQKLYPAEMLKNWPERNHCPKNDQLCQEAVWFTQNMLLAPRNDMEQIAEAIRRIQSHAGEIARA